MSRGLSPWAAVAGVVVFFAAGALLPQPDWFGTLADSITTVLFVMVAYRYMRGDRLEWVATKSEQTTP